MICTVEGCSLPAQGNTRAPAPDVSHGGSLVLIPVHECLQCRKHCAIRAYLVEGGVL